MCFKKILYYSLPLLSGFFMLESITAQNIAITNDESYIAHPSAMLDVKAVDKGVLVPRLTTDQKLAVTSPATGLLVFDSDEGDFFFYNGTGWTNLTSANASGLWGQNGNRVFLNDTTYHLGIGTNTPIGKMEVKADGDIGTETAIFGVINYNGDTVFAVYPGGVRVLVEDDQAKAGGNRSGFAVGGFSLSKGDFTNNYLHISPDSVRIYIEDTIGGTKTGGNKGGFAVGGFSLSKGTLTNEYLTVTDATTQVFVGDSTAGFGVTNIEGTSGDNLIHLTTENYFVGHQSGAANTTGRYNSFMGYLSGASNETGEYNSFYGYKSGYANLSGVYNSFYGFEAGKSNTTGTSNVFIGLASGASNLDGSENTFIGTQAGQSNTAGCANIFIGKRTGLLNTTGNENCFIGVFSGYKNTTGMYNTFLGSGSGMKNTIGSSNTYTGVNCGTENTSGLNNAFYGSFSGHYNTTGSYNTFYGSHSGYHNTTGIHNVCIGDSAGYNLNGSGNVCIGYGAGFNVDADNNLIIANQITYSPTLAFIYGNFASGRLRVNNYLGIGRSPSVNKLEVEGDASKTTAGTWLANSDKRIKKNIKTVDNAIEILMKLRPVTFEYTDEWMKIHPEIEDKTYYNFIAQEYREAFPRSVKGSGEYLDGDKDEILQIDTYNAQVVTIKAVQELVMENRELKEENRKMKAEIENIMEIIQPLTNK